MADYSAPKINIRITNLSQIQAAFKRAPYLMAKEFGQTIKKVVEGIKTEAREVTPIDTGLLRSSYYTKYNPYSALGFYGEVGTGIPGKPSAYYDVYVHEGTRYMRGRPYLKNTVNREAHNTEDEFTKALQRVLDKIGVMV